MHKQHFHHGCGRGSRRRRYPSSEELLQALEEHQKDLEQETADLADLIRRLREERPVAPETASV